MDVRFRPEESSSDTLLERSSLTSVLPRQAKEISAEARAVLVVEGNRRRERLRIVRALNLATVCGLLAFFLSHFVWRRHGWEIHIANGLFQAVSILLRRIASPTQASRRQTDALKLVLDGAEKADLAWLIEGTQYADTPALRMALLDKIRGFFAELTPEDAVLLPEGARKILRSWSGGLFRQEPERMQETLRALAVIEDAKLPKLLRGIARWRPRHLGDEETIRLATDALCLPPRVFPAPPKTRSDAEQVIVWELQLRKKWNLWARNFSLIAVAALLVAFVMAFVSGRYEIIGLGAAAMLLAVVVAGKKAMIDADSTYREAVAEATLKENADG